MENENTFINVWDALEDTPSDSQKMKLKSELMTDITEFIKQKNWDKNSAAKNCGLTIPRINDLLKGKINNFSFDSLFNIVSALGHKVKISIEY